MVKTSDGKQYRVKHPDYVAISPKGGRITLYDDEETTTTVSALHMVAWNCCGREARPLMWKKRPEFCAAKNVCLPR